MAAVKRGFFPTWTAVRPPASASNDDTFGLADAVNGISHVHQEFLEAGGTDILAGDGALDYGGEKSIETHSDCDLWKTIHIALDYQFISDPAFNQARGPVSVFNARALGILES
jgi:high affinity Mn2+ porin